MASDQALAWSTPLFIAGTGLSAFTSGAIASISLITVPALLTLPTNAALLSTWRAVFNIGGSIARPLAATTTLVHAVNAYINYRSSSSPYNWKYLAAAGASTIAIVPFTLILMMPTNHELERLENIARGTVTAAEPAVVNLVKKWSTFNITRAFLPAMGALAAFMAL